LVSLDRHASGTFCRRKTRVKNLIIFGGAVGAVLLYLLSSSGANTEVFSFNYYALLWLTGLLAVGLMGLAAYQFWLLRSKLKNQVFGAKLALRLVLFFTLIAVLPGILIYAVSVQFLDKSIESWFDVRVEKALEGGLNLGRSGLDNSLQELAKKTRLAATLLSEKNASQYQQTLNQLVDTKVAQQAGIFDLEGTLIAASKNGGIALPDMPDGELLRVVLDRGGYSVIDTLPDSGLILRALTMVNPNVPTGKQSILQFVQPVPKQVEQDAETVQSVYRDYQQLTLSRVGLKRLYAITLTLALLVVLLTAVSAAFFISTRISSSLEALAEGTREVAQGNFSGQYPVQTRDELGALTGLFNQMTRQLAEAKTASESQQRQMVRAKGYLESVLTHLSSGVLGFDEELKLRSVNTSAVQILSAPLNTLHRMGLSEIAEKYPLLNTFCATIGEAFGRNTTEDWERQIERVSKQGNQSLLMRGTRLPHGSGAGYVVVFDDISHLLQAERQSAWGEVARRLAHEIKNPLTPIQLSAERLQHRLNGKLDEENTRFLLRATDTIVTQVTAMKNMVNDFADYARGPALNLTRLELHALIFEVLGLYEAAATPIVPRLHAARSTINGDATRLRQVIHNLLQNAQDALQGNKNPRITIDTLLLDHELHFSVSDNGAGFPESVLSRSFEPYMTTKPKGTGLGLAIVKKIIEEHGGRISIGNLPDGGALIQIILPLAGET
jgi:nitrogen fixation/metabolism regulation signal transduction histidine kinase